MDHEAYEQQMIDTVNRHAKEESQSADVPTTQSAFTTADARTLKRGLKRIMVALFTAVLFFLTVYDFIAVATAKGYWAVFLFLVGIVMTAMTFILLYAQGMTRVESKGEKK